MVEITFVAIPIKINVVCEVLILFCRYLVTKYWRQCLPTIFIDEKLKIICLRKEILLLLNIGISIHYQNWHPRLTKNIINKYCNTKKFLSKKHEITIILKTAIVQNAYFVFVY